MKTQDLLRIASTGHQIRKRYIAGAGAVLALAVAIGTIGGHGVPTKSQAVETPLAAAAPAGQSTSEMPGTSSVAQSAIPSDTIYVVRSGRQALALRHSQSELTELPRAQVLVIGYGTNAKTAWQEMKAARESSEDGTASVIDLR